MSLCVKEENEQLYSENYIQELNQMRDCIENMSKFNQIGLLRKLSLFKDVTLNENKYGVHVNLTDLKSDVIDDLKKYINYVTTQESSLQFVEKQKETYKNTFFAKDNKDFSSKRS
jgi:hypothetical protein